MPRLNKVELTTENDIRIVDEAIRFMYANIGGISALQIFFPISVSWMFWNRVAHVWVISWMIGCLLVYVVRIILSRKFMTSAIPTGDYPRWARYFTATSLVSGLLWGSAGIIFYSPDSLNLQVLLYVIIVGVAAGSLVVNCYWLPAFYAYSVPSVGLVALNLLYQADSPGKVLGVLLILYLLIFAQIARKTHEMMYHAIHVQFENLALVEELKMQKERAELASRAKTRFLASANHDLRQPVHALSLMTYAARDELVSERGKRLYKSMDRTIRSLSQLLESLLDLSRLDAGAMAANHQRVALKPLGVQLLTEYLPIAQRKRLRIGLGPFDYSVYTDIGLLERVLRNLVSNAVRYTSKGGVLIGCRRRGEFVVIEIWDTGVGIAEEDGKNIFTEFYQGQNLARDRSQGLGLGLSICQRIAALLGHEFTFNSVVGRGTVFRIKLPISHQQVKAVTAERDRVAELKHLIFGKCVLIVDDERDVREALSQVITMWGGKTLIAASGDEALQILAIESTVPDCIICDFRLANNEDGVQAIKRIRESMQRPDLAALILTGDTAPELVAALELSEFPVIHKPVHPLELFDILVWMLRDYSSAK